MNPQKELHFQRLRESLQYINNLKDYRGAFFDPSFKSWKERTKQSLGELFGKDHNYTRRFASLEFWNVRVAIRMNHRAAPEWSHGDQVTFGNDIERAKNILTEALEEYSVVPTEEAKSVSVPPMRPQIVVYVNNILSQSMNIDISQVISNLETLGLPPDQLSKAKTHARELAEETKGAQRWPILAKSLEALKSMGKSVYENVALPLLLEMLKNQTGFKS